MVSADRGNLTLKAGDVVMVTGSLSWTFVGIAKGMALNSAGLPGGGRSPDESSESQFVISDIITVNAGHVTGSYSHDVVHANGALTNKFDAQKFQNQIWAASSARSSSVR